MVWFNWGKPVGLKLRVLLPVAMNMFVGSTGSCRLRTSSGGFMIRLKAHFVRLTLFSLFEGKKGRMGRRRKVVLGSVVNPLELALSWANLPPGHCMLAAVTSRH